MNDAPEFHAYGSAHLVVIGLTIAMPFLLAAIARTRRIERAIAAVIITLLVVNYVGYIVFIRAHGMTNWLEMLPLQMCDWGMVVVIVALWTASAPWFEVAYFWGIGGTLQAVLTPNLPYGFPDLRFFSFFISHSAIIVGVVFLMMTHRLRPYPISIVRVWLWSELYFVVTLVADKLTGVNYGFLLHKPEAFSLLSLLADWRPLYLLQMQGLALLFFVLLYVPFAIADLIRGNSSMNAANREGNL